MPHPSPTGQPHATPVPGEAGFAQLVIADGGPEVQAEFTPQFAQAFLNALARVVVGSANECRVTGIIAVGDKIVNSATRL